MIGVLADLSDHPAASEFFVLTGTSWEFWRPTTTYDIVVNCGRGTPGITNTRMVLTYEDSAVAATLCRRKSSFEPQTFLAWGDRQVPLYLGARSYTGSTSFVRETSTGESALKIEMVGQCINVAIGYALLGEVNHLLVAGQPASQAMLPTLERHIELLRELITRAGMPYVEILPSPHGHPFIACLTHDIDHPVLRNHLADHTMAGFLYRGTAGSLVDLGRGRKRLSSVARNCTAVARLPLVYLGLARDPWASFDRYIDIERGRPSTYFVITEPNRPGVRSDGPAPRRRACRYTLEDITPQLSRILSHGNEVALHGLDAWIDHTAAERERAFLLPLLNRFSHRREPHLSASRSGRAAKEDVFRSARASQTNPQCSSIYVAPPTRAEPGIGVRMHWLYYGAETPLLLDSAGFSYDATVGYNQTVGFRAGSARVYRPLGSRHLLELPLIVMDTALFYPDYLGLPEDEAWEVVTQLLDVTGTYGGAFTVNWHDRSIAPERLWEGFYVRLLSELEKRRAWFATASGAIAWFQKRRQAVLDYSWSGEGHVHVKAMTVEDTLPPLSIRVHAPRNRQPTGSLEPEYPSRFRDTPLNGPLEIDIPL